MAELRLRAVLPATTLPRRFTGPASPPGPLCGHGPRPDPAAVRPRPWPAGPGSSRGRSLAACAGLADRPCGRYSGAVIYAYRAYRPARSQVVTETWIRRLDGLPPASSMSPSDPVYAAPLSDSGRAADGPGTPGAAAFDDRHRRVPCRPGAGRAGSRRPRTVWLTMSAGPASRSPPSCPGGYVAASAAARPPSRPGGSRPAVSHRDPARRRQPVPCWRPRLPPVAVAYSSAPGSADPACPPVAGADRAPFAPGFRARMLAAGPPRPRRARAGAGQHGLPALRLGGDYGGASTLTQAIFRLPTAAEGRSGRRCRAVSCLVGRGRLQRGGVHRDLPCGFGAACAPDRPGLDPGPAASRIAAGHEPAVSDSPGEPGLAQPDQVLPEIFSISP